jgi:hypothetical protein
MLMPPMISEIKCCHRARGKHVAERQRRIMLANMHSSSQSEYNAMRRVLCSKHFHELQPGESLL